MTGVYTVGLSTSVLRKVLAAVSIVAILVTGVGVAIFLFTRMDELGSAASSSRSSLVPPEPKIPTPQEFQVGVQVTDQQCAPDDRCVYTYSIQPDYVGFHPLPDHDFAVFYEIVGGTDPQPGNFTVSDGQARIYKDVTIEGPPGAQLTARVTRISPIAGPKPLPGPGAKTEDMSPMPIN